MYAGLDPGGTKVEETFYEYNLQGRLGRVTLDADGNGTPETQLEYEYDDSGIRVAQTKTIDGNGDGDFVDPGDTSERTEYLVDAFNPTGYAQVLEEKIAGAIRKAKTEAGRSGRLSVLEKEFAGAILKSYTLGLDVIGHKAPGRPPLVPPFQRWVWT